MSKWAERVPAILQELNVLKDELQRRFPNVASDESETEVQYSGSYWNEADYYEPEWQSSFWGKKNYAKLLGIKQKYDPDGIFTCHNCVGSEFRTADGNCKLHEDMIV